MHALYGFSAIIAVGILYSYRTSPFMKGKELLLYGFGCLFIMGLGLRNLCCERVSAVQPVSCDSRVSTATWSWAGSLSPNWA